MKILQILNEFVLSTGEYKNESEVTNSYWELIKEVMCEEKCILYSGILVYGQCETTILAGTVFQELVIWSYNNSSEASLDKSMMAQPVTHRLTGHEGVIFSVNFNANCRLISTTSDDRTTRLWKINDIDASKMKDDENYIPLSSNQNYINWKFVEIGLHKVLSGIHVSRVFRSQFLFDNTKSDIDCPTIIATAGEDSKICLWNTLTGKNIDTFIHDKHGKSPIWSITSTSDFIGTNLLFSGGADSGVKMWQYLQTDSGCGNDTTVCNSKQFEIPSERCNQASEITDNTKKTNSTNDYPRIVLHLKNTSHTLCLTNSGKVFILSLGDNQEESDSKWILLMNDTELFNYALMEYYPENDKVQNLRGKITFATLDGSIKIYNLFCGDNSSNFSTSNLSCKLYASFQNVHQGKIFAMALLSANNSETRSEYDAIDPEKDKKYNYSIMAILTCGDSGVLKLHQLVTNESATDPELIIVDQFQMPTFKNKASIKSQFWFSCATVIDDKFLIVGDRMGNIHLFPFKYRNRTTEVLPPCQTLWKIHGRLGVGDMKLSKSGKELWSTGRDGCVRSFTIQQKICNDFSNNSAKTVGEDVQYYLEEKSCSKLKMSWPEKILIASDNKIVILGFQSSNFIVYDLQENVTYCEINCGGSHRSWDYAISETTGDFIVTYIKEKHVFHEKVPGFEEKINGSLQVKNSPVSIIRPSFHSRELASLHCFKMKHVQNCRFMVTGGEDTALKIQKIYYENDRLRRKKIATLNGHISNVKCISSLELDKSVILVSAGGRAQLKVWHLTYEKQHDSKEAASISCREIAAHMLKGNDKIRKKKSWKTSDLVVEDVETRFMDIDLLQQDSPRHEGILIASACSDGVIRVLSVSVEKHMKNNSTYHHNDKTCYSNAWYKNQLSVKVEAQSEVHSHSFLRVKFVKNMNCKQSFAGEACEKPILILATCTDGKLYRIRYFPKCAFASREEPYSLRIEEIVSLHQSGINGLCVAERTSNTKDEHELLIITGGDDGSVSAAKLDNNLTLISATCKSSKQSTPQHSAPVTGICQSFVNNLNIDKIDEHSIEENIGSFASCSVDQRVCLWKLVETQFQNNDGRRDSVERSSQKEMKIVNVTKILSNVPDIQAITSFEVGNSEQKCNEFVREKILNGSEQYPYPQNSNEFLAVAGVGIEIFGFNYKPHN